MTNITDYIPIAVALLSGVGVRLLEHAFSRRSVQVKEIADLRQAELERDKWVVEKSIAMVERLEKQLLETQGTAAALRLELAAANEMIRQMEIRNM